MYDMRKFVQQDGIDLFLCQQCKVDGGDKNLHDAVVLSDSKRVFHGRFQKKQERLAAGGRFRRLLRQGIQERRLIFFNESEPTHFLFVGRSSLKRKKNSDQWHEEHACQGECRKDKKEKSVILCSDRDTGQKLRHAANEQDSTQEQGGGIEAAKMRRAQDFFSCGGGVFADVLAYPIIMLLHFAHIAVQHGVILAAGQNEIDCDRSEKPCGADRSHGDGCSHGNRGELRPQDASCNKNNCSQKEKDTVEEIFHIMSISYADDLSTPKVFISFYISIILFLPKRRRFFPLYKRGGVCYNEKNFAGRERMAPADSEKIELLLRALRSGDAEALDGIYACLGGRMLALARGIVRNRADAEDVVSDSFLKLARGIGGYRIGTNGCAFVMRIVRNTAFDLLRKRKVRAEEDLDEFFHLTDERYRPERMDGALVLEDAVAKLAPLERRMIYYRYYLDFTVREIAKETGVSKSAVQRMVSAAEEKLKKLLSEGQTDA